MSKKLEMGDRKVHYIIALPHSGIPTKVMSLIKNIESRYGSAHVVMYTAPSEFSAKTGGSRYIKTFYWVEISEKPLPLRASAEWPC